MSAGCKGATADPSSAAPYVHIVRTAPADQRKNVVLNRQDTQSSPGWVGEYSTVVSPYALAEGHR